MQTVGEFRPQEVIDQTLPLDAAYAFEFGGHHPYAIVRASAFARPGVSRVKIGLVDHVKRDGIERLLQPRDNSLLHDHRFGTPVKQIATLHIVCWGAGLNTLIDAGDWRAFPDAGRFRTCP